MTLLSATLRARLARSRILSRRAAATSGHGDRTGGAASSGIEFAEYRAFEPGDDARRIDPGVYARLEQTVVRRYMAQQSLAITVLLDHTASMGVPSQGKAQLARQLAAALTYAGLRAGDRVRLGAFDGDGLALAPAASDVKRSEATFRWLAKRVPRGRIPLLDVSNASRQWLPKQGLLVLVSDGWSSDAEAALRRWSAAGQELVFLLVADPTELDPASLGPGPVRMVDAETGRSVDVVLDAETIERRRHAVAEWHDSLRSEVSQSLGRFVVVPSQRPLERIVLHDLVAAGVIA